MYAWIITRCEWNVWIWFNVAAVINEFRLPASELQDDAHTFPISLYLLPTCTLTFIHSPANTCIIRIHDKNERNMNGTHINTKEKQQQEWTRANCHWITYIYLFIHRNSTESTSISNTWAFFLSGRGNLSETIPMRTPIFTNFFARLHIHNLFISMLFRLLFVFVLSLPLTHHSIRSIIRSYSFISIPCSFLLFVFPSLDLYHSRYTNSIQFAPFSLNVFRVLSCDDLNIFQIHSTLIKEFVRYMCGRANGASSLYIWFWIIHI